MKRTLAVLLFLALLALPARGADRRETLELRVPMKVGESVTALMPDGSEVTLGRVLMTPVKTNWPAYTASKWCAPATVCATAVNRRPDRKSVV